MVCVCDMELCAKLEQEGDLLSIVDKGVYHFVKHQKSVYFSSFF